MILLHTITMKAAMLLLVLFVAVRFDAAEANTTTLNLNQHEMANLTELTVHKSPTCGCCQKWIDHVEEHAFLAKVNDLKFLSELKEDKGIATNYRSCHTAESSNGYVFEGHIPAKYITQFLQQIPENAIGLSVPAMPIGSPGMEVQDRFMPYQVLLLKDDGTVSVYAQIDSYEEQF
jgi:hypothetical protein